MNVSCRGVLMKEVASEQEAMDEIKRYLEVNGLDCKWVSIATTTCEEKYTGTSGRTKEVRIGINDTNYEIFDIRYDHEPPFRDISDEKISQYSLNKNEARYNTPRSGYVANHKYVLWRNEFTNYMNDMKKRTGVNS